MRRRTMIAGLGATVIWPLVVRAQQADRMRRVGVLMGPGANAETNSWVDAFLRRLDELGWKEGRNVHIDVRWGNGDPKIIEAAARDLLAQSPDVLIPFNNLTLHILQPMAEHVPIVFAGVGDPVGGGFVASLDHPGGTVTGFASFEGPMGGKWLQILKEAAPRVTRVLTILHRETPVHLAFWQWIEAAAQRLGVEATFGAVHDTAEIERVMTSFAAEPNGGVIVLPHALTVANRKLITDLELQYRLPALHSGMEGGLASYSPDWKDEMRRTAEYADRILKGERPADLPVQFPTKFTLVLDLKTAKALDLEVPPTLLALADEVIE